MSFESAYSEVATLVENFRKHEPEYLKPNYQESECRQSFIDKFFIALGWDVYHHQQTNPREQEVKIERGDGMSTRRADYAFYLKPDFQRPQFLVEAKKPSVVLAMPDNYFQTARYGFNTSTSVALLTNFRELHIVDCRRRPENTAGIVESARLKIYNYEDYLDRDKFGEIYWTFSHEALEQGKLKEYRKSLPKPKGKAKQLKLIGDALAPVDDQFLAELDEHRKTLASAFKKSNPELSAEELTEAAQKVLDRLVFIRFLEDKMIEPDFIVDKFCVEGSAWKKFVNESRLLDKKYNGVVFKDHLIDRRDFNPPDDERFFGICEEMNHNNSPYLFSYIPVEILGSIYERFLGKVVVAKGRGIAVEEKPEVRKAGGVYYTPKYIVDYIVENTVGKMIEGKTPKEIAKMRFADIACGSGSFLIAIFDTVLHYLEHWYNNHPDEAKKSPRLLKAGVGGWSLSLESKRQILKQNIFGVDIDHQAVEVAQFSLFLKLLESETISTAEAFQTDAFTTSDKTILPDLTKNILCGNSLVEYDIAQLFPLTPEEEERIKPFSFQQSFKEIMQTGGFDAIVGNPPYVNLKRGFLSAAEKNYCEKRYKTAVGQYDQYALFIERAVNLLRGRGVAGYIVPKPILSSENYECVRKLLLANDLYIVAESNSPFRDASVEAVVVCVEKGAAGQRALLFERLRDGNRIVLGKISSKYFYQLPFTNISYLLNEQNVGIVSKIVGKPLKDHCHIFTRGIEAGKSSAVKLANPSTKSKRLLRGEDVSRYSYSFESYYYTPNTKNVRQWKSKDIYEADEKLLIRRVTDSIVATLDTEHFWTLNTLYSLIPDGINILLLLALLNSRLISYYFTVAFLLDDKLFPYLRISQLERIPICKMETVEAKKDALSIQLLVSQVLEATRRLAESQSDSQREQLQRKCDYLDAEIDRLVYQLYGLTEEEIGIVEGKG